MLRSVVILVLGLSLGGCAKLAKLMEPEPQFQVYLACRESFAVVKDGKNRVLLERLPWGVHVPLPVTARANEPMQLSAAVYSMITGEPLGAAYTSVTAPGYTVSDSKGNTWVRKDTEAQLSTWNIASLDRYPPHYTCDEGHRER